MNIREIEDILWRAAAIGFGMLTFSFLMMWVFHDGIVSIHSYIFPGIGSSDLHASIYILYGVMKVLLFIFFIIPALALMWQRKSK